MNILETNLKFNEPLIPIKIDNLKYFVYHHIEAKTATPEQLHMWHLENGWNGAGYNYYIRKDGSIYRLRGLNIGAHCKGYNSEAIGIAFEGNFEVEAPFQNKYFGALTILSMTNNE